MAIETKKAMAHKTASCFAALAAATLLTGCAAPHGAPYPRTLLPVVEHDTDVPLFLWNAAGSFLLMPFTAGPPEGGGPPLSFSLHTRQEAVSVDAAFGLTTTEGAPASSPSVQDEAQLWRILLNRFDPRRGAKALPFLHSRPELFADVTQKINDRASPLAGQRRLNLAAAGCPPQPVLWGQETGAAPSLYTLQDTGVTEKNITRYDNGDSCVIVIGAPLAEPDIEQINRSFLKALTRFKQIIYRDAMTQEGEGYAFRPLLIAAPFGYFGFKPLAPVAVAGAYVAALDTVNGRPTLLVNSDLQMIEPTLDDRKAREVFHATIVHELQHAINRYYKVWRAGIADGESVLFDEGLAYLAEDLMGYGALGFADNVAPFVGDFWQTGVFFPRDDHAERAVAQGGLHTLLHYLLSQRGGVTFLDGEPVESGGLAFLREFVAGTATGPAALRATTGSELADIFGNFLGALTFDGTHVKDPLYQCQPAGDKITDTKGEIKSYGFRLNLFEGLVDHSRSDSYASDDPWLGKEHDIEPFVTHPFFVVTGTNSCCVRLTTLHAAVGSWLKVLPLP